jgi:hypothetical protein
MVNPPIIGAIQSATRTYMDRIDLSVLIRQVSGIFHHLVKRALGAAIPARAKPVRDIAAQHMEALSLFHQNL